MWLRTYRSPYGVRYASRYLSRCPTRPARTGPDATRPRYVATTWRFCRWYREGTSKVKKVESKVEKSYSGPTHAPPTFLTEWRVHCRLLLLRAALISAVAGEFRVLPVEGTLRLRTDTMCVPTSGMVGGPMPMRDDSSSVRGHTKSKQSGLQLQHSYFCWLRANVLANARSFVVCHMTGSDFLTSLAFTP